MPYSQTKSGPTLFTNKERKGCNNQDGENGRVIIKLFLETFEVINGFRESVKVELCGGWHSLEELMNNRIWCNHHC